MATLYKKWSVLYISSEQKILGEEFYGTLEECVRFVEPRCYGYYAIKPKQETNPCDGCELSDTIECKFCGQDPELI